MYIIQKQPNSNGAYPIQSWEATSPPNTHYEIVCNCSECFDGFIIPTVVDNKVISFVCNTKLWEVFKFGESRKEAEAAKVLEVAELKSKLESTDYKVIKCYEYSLAGLPAPYDAVTLHAERQALRDKITELGG